MNRNRVVITGLGAVTCLGPDVPALWEGLLQGKSGIRRITQFDASAMPCQIAGEIPEFDPTQYMERKEARRFPRSSQVALGAAAQAIQQAGLSNQCPIPSGQESYSVPPSEASKR